MLYSEFVGRLVSIFGVVVLAASAQQTPKIVGEASSTAALEIDGTTMAPAPSWPLVDRDEVRTTSAPGLLLTPDRNAITLMPDTTVRVRVLPPSQTWIFLREGGLSVDTKNRSVFICVANRVFQPSASARGTLDLKKSGTVSSAVTSGSFTELKVSACGENLAQGMTTGPVAGGTATPSGPGLGTIAAAAGGFAAGGIATGFVAASGGSTSGTCTSSTGCNFNPVPVSPSGP